MSPSSAVMGAFRNEDSEIYLVSKFVKDIKASLAKGEVLYDVLRIKLNHPTCQGSCVSCQYVVRQSNAKYGPHASVEITWGHPGMNQTFKG